MLSVVWNIFFTIISIAAFLVTAGILREEWEKWTEWKIEEKELNQKIYR